MELLLVNMVVLITLQVIPKFQRVRGFTGKELQEQTGEVLPWLVAGG